MSFTSKDNPCKSFAPNIFNKNKCQNCFRPRETHLQSNKDLNKAKPIYGGWLLLAPIGTDFANPMHKNRKWQRRWFVLFEHGALRYALDENITTVAQGTIDMNHCSEVMYADSITDQKYSLCICLPDQKWFMRGENREDIMGWYDQLIVYPETNKEEMRRKKRLFQRKSEVPRLQPAAAATSATSYSAPNTPLTTKSQKPSLDLAQLLMKADNSAKISLGSPLLSRSRNSSTSSSIKSPSSEKSGFLSPRNFSHRSDVVDAPPVSALADRPSSYADLSSSRDLRSGGRPSQPNSDVHSMDESSNVKANNLDTSYFLVERKTSESASSIKTESVKNERLQRHISVSTSSLDSTASNHSLSESTDGSHSGNTKQKHFKDYHNFAEVPKAKRISSRHYQEQKKEVEKKSRARSPGRNEVDRIFGKERRRSRVIETFEVPKADISNKENTEPASSSPDPSSTDQSSSSLKPASTKSSPVSPRDPDHEDKRGRSISRRSTNMKQGTQTEQAPPRSSTAALRRAKSLDRKSYESIQLNADLFNVKKGWLTKQNKDGNWSKHWFVLANKELRYYQASAAEDTVNPDGTIDIRNCKDVRECDVQRNYGFEIKTDEDTFIFAAMTSGIRKNWINAILKSKETPKDSNVTMLDRVEHPKVFEDKPPIAPESAASKKSGYDDISVTERSQRRRARIRDRRKEGRARTFDFAEFRLAAQAATPDPAKDTKLDIAAAPKSEVKARSRTFNADALLRDLKISSTADDNVNPKTSKKSLNLQDNKPESPLIPRSASGLQLAIEEEWKKLEKIEYSSLNGEVAPLANPITETATMVKALQNEVDSLKKQMERVQLERTASSSDDYLDSGLGTLSSTADFSDCKLQGKLDQQNNQIDKLKQQLSAAQESLRKQSSELRECGMQLDISLSESQVAETQLANAQGELLLEKSRREEDEKDHKRKVNALNKELEESDSRLKKSENLHLEAQRRIRELERQVNMQKDHNKEEALLQDHITMLRRHAEEQETEMKDLQEAFEARCQNQKELEDRLSEAKDVIKSYEEQLHDMKEAMKELDKKSSVMSSHRAAPQVDIEKLTSDLEASRLSEENLKEKIARLLMHNQGDKKLLQDELTKEREACERLRNILKDHDDDFAINEKQLLEVKTSIDELKRRLDSAEEGKATLQRENKELGNENRKLKEQLSVFERSSQQTVRELRTRLYSAEKQLGDIEEIRSREASVTESSFKAKLTELEADMGGTGQMIAARLMSLEPSRRVSDPAVSLDKESASHKIHRLELELARKEKELFSAEEKLKEVEIRETEAEDEFTAKLKELNANQDTVSSEFEKTIRNLKLDSQELEEKLEATQDCLRELYSRASQLNDVRSADGYAAKLLISVLHDTLKLSEGHTDLSETPERSPSPDRGDTKWGRVTDAESRQQNQRTMSRLKQLTERLKSSDGRLVSPSGSPLSILGQSGSSSVKTPSSGTSRPENLPLVTSVASLGEDSAAQLFAKQISMQALLLAEMAATLRRSQSTPALGSVGRSQPNFNHNNRQSSPQLTSAEFSDTIAHHTTNGGLLQHVDTLAQKLTLEGMLMCELARLKDSWGSNRGRSLSQRAMGPGVPSSELSSSMVAHAQISYVVQVYNERISRLALEARQARHRADAAMRKLRELVQACKTQDLEAVSNLAVQVDTDSLAPPYSDIPPWEQQVDYGTLHGAQSVSSPPSSEATILDQEANFFQHLADDLKCMSADVQSLSKLGVQLVLADHTLQKFLQPSEIGEHASTVAREAIVQAEIIYISHRLRRDYDEELRKAKNAVTEQATHFEALKKKLKQTDEHWSGKLKQLTEEHNAKVVRLMQEASRLEKTRAEMSKDVEERLTRLSRKHEQELATCNAKHEQECSTLRKELSSAKNQLQTKTKEYMSEVKNLTQRLDQIKVKHRSEGDEARSEYNRKVSKAKSECEREVKKLKKDRENDVKKLKDDFVKEISEAEKEFKDKLTSIEAANRQEISELKKKHRNNVKTMEEDHKEALKVAKRDGKDKAASIKRDLDDLLQQERAKHQVELKAAQDDAEKNVREQVRQKTNELKKEHDNVLKNRDRLHKEQLEREKEIWTKELKQQWEAEAEEEAKICHKRSASLTSESDSKDALKERISSLEEQLTSVQGKLENEQHEHSYQYQLDEIRTLCDESFAAIEESHAKKLDEMMLAHKREVERLKEEHTKELEENNEDTRRAILSVRKHHSEEMKSIRGQPDHTGYDRYSSLRREQEKLKREIETLSEHYSKKCVELEHAREKNEKLDERLRALERDNRRLQAKQDALDEQNYDSQVKKLKVSDSDGKKLGDFYQLQVMLRVRASEIDYLKQEVTSLSKELEEGLQEKKESVRKHHTLFDELTLSRSREGLVRREVTRLKEQLRRAGIVSDEGSDSDEGVERSEEKGKGYDFQKSRSQPDLPANTPTHRLPSTSYVTSSSTSVKRRSSEKAGKDKV
ncbi:uncharacterized protein LOC143451296 isoform X3 [Clavelina lepadiformis]|uniref:uncharacterized protein LOC143451296 isoform X3 n=1 Tax=Clavelina lepadiformis TaxID=159417 RepID=UPI004042BC9B